MKTVEKRLEDEQKFHNEIFESNKRTSEVGQLYTINEAINNAYEGFIFESPKNKVYLEYGCGMAKGGRLTKLVKQGAKTHGIDISDYAIEFLKQEAKEEGLDIDYQIMNAEDMTFQDSYFDVIYGTGILHHLDLEKSFESFGKKLKKDGTAIFIEPLGHNPLINRFRDKTPEIRTEDEHPLLMQDFKFAKKYFKNVDIEYFYLTTLGVPMLFKKSQPRFLINFFNGVDRILFALFPFIRKHAWQVIVKFSDPKD